MRLLAVISMALAPLPMWAGEIAVAPGELAAALLRAEPGDRLVLAPGDYAGPIVLNQTLTLDGGGAAHIRGDGSGSVITVTAESPLIEAMQEMAAREAGRALVVDGDRLLGLLSSTDVLRALEARRAAEPARAPAGP